MSKYHRIILDDAYARQELMENASSPIVAAFAERLIQCINKSGKTQKELAEAIGITPSTFNAYIKGSQEPRICQVEIIADYFQVSTDYLLGRANCRNISNEEIHKKTGLSDEAISVLRYYKTFYDDSDTDNILPVINFLLACEMSKFQIIHMQALYDQNKDELLPDEMFDEMASGAEIDYSKYPDKSVYSPSHKKVMAEYAHLCGKPLKGGSAFSLIKKYLNTPINSKLIYITDNNELFDETGIQTAKYKVSESYIQNEIIENMLLRQINNALDIRRERWRENKRADHLGDEAHKTE
ncbi:MAG: helix-turn-helix domain-containing protein [Eubacteriales bacterium]